MRFLVIVHSEYWTEEASRYRLAISRESLIPTLSLQQASVSLVLKTCLSDPRWRDRMNAFDRLAVTDSGIQMVPHWEQKELRKRQRPPYIEIEMGDDILLRPEAFAVIRECAEQFAARDSGINPCYMNFPAGSIWSAGREFPIQTATYPMRIRLVRHQRPFGATKAEFPDHSVWLQPVHSMMNISAPDGWEQLESHSICVPGVSSNILSRYCRTQVCTGTAVGATRFYSRGRSFILAAGWRGRRPPCNR